MADVILFDFFGTLVDYQAALGGLGCQARHAVFVGDDYEADYLGPTAAGMAAFLIDATGRHPVPPDRRLDTILDLPGRL